MILNHQRKASMKRILFCIIAILFCYPSFSLADDREMSCSSNAYIVEEMYYFENYDFKNKTSFDKFPELMSDYAKNIFKKAQSLPINASGTNIQKLFNEKYKMENFDKILQKYKWDFSQDEYNYKLSISKFRGCISEISLFAYQQQNLKKNIMFTQENRIPSGYITVKLNDNINYCKKLRMENQKFIYLKNNKIPENDSRDIPDLAKKLFILIGNYYNNRRDVLFEKIGPPKDLNSTTKQWFKKDANGLNFEVTLKTLDNCDSKLEISWYNKHGEYCSLQKENFY
jgi:hypothetical protein